jgi:HAD superfamily hydrolase (TIGR01509 family)
MSLKALIFDVDGTLAETEKDGHRVAFNLAFKESNLPWQWDIDLYGELLEIGGGKERLRHYLQHYQPTYEPPEELDIFLRRLHQNKSNYFRQLLENSSIPLRIGVKRLLEEAYQSGIKLAIASTASVDNVNALLENSLDGKIAQFFSVIAAGDMVEKKKPAPDIYLLALEQLNLSPEECLAIEDTHQGLIAATTAGLTTVVTVNEYTQNQDFELASLVLNHLGDIDHPFTVIQGNSHNYDYFNLDLANQLRS